jgi:hypothetical protein
MKKIINSVLLSSLLLVGTSSSTFANETDNRGAFGAFVFTPNTADGTIEGYELDGGGMIGGVFGNKKLFSDSLGLYGSFDMSYNSVDETDSSDAIYGYRIFNIGATYTPFDSVTLLTGIGISWEYGEIFSYGTHYKTEEDEINMNLHAGLAYTITDKYGAIVTYNTASSSVGIGIIWSF